MKKFNHFRDFWASPIRKE